MRTLISFTMVAVMLAIPAAAQDSVAPQAQYVAGDAVWWLDDQTGPFGSEQINTFVVDMYEFQSSWENNYRIAPLVKSSKTGATFRGSLLSAQGVSPMYVADAGFPFSDYQLWTQAGYGINAEINLDPANPQNPAGPSFQFATAFAEFGTSDAGASINNIVGAVVNVLPDDPGRLYVGRVLAATNAAFPNENRAQLGFGSVDGWGNVHFRADGFGITGPNPIQGQNYFRVRMIDQPGGALGRDGAELNLIDDVVGFGFHPDEPATDWVLVSSPTTHNTPTILPTQLGGPRVLGSNFNTEYYAEGVPSAGAHLAAGLADHRGNVFFSPKAACTAQYPTSVGTCGMIAEVGGDTHAIALWHVDATGAVIPGSQFFVDGRDSGLTPGAFDHYHSQVAFRGGNGQIAIGEDQAGRGLAAGPWYIGDLSTTDANNAIIVARWDCGAASPDDAEWAVAAQIPVDPAQRSPIYGGPSGNDVIGRLAELNETPSTRNGPSLSAPMFDSVGNVYFVSAMELFDPQGGPSTFTTGLFRAVYDPATFSYKLELILKFFDEFMGINSNTPYNISYIGLADSNSVDSNAPWSGNIIQDAFMGMDPASLDPADPRTLGGLVLFAEITYDSDGDGDYGFADPGQGNTDEDQDYNVVLFIAPGTVADFTPCDTNCDGAINAGDIDPFVLALTNPAAYAAAYPNCDINSADVNGDGSINAGDIDPFVACIVGK